VNIANAAQAVVIQKNKLSEIFQDYGVELAFLFGSSTEQEISLIHDIDIAVLFSSYDFERYLETLFALNKAIKQKNVDLVVLNLANPALKMEALLKGILLYCTSSDAFARFSAATFFDYDDYSFFKKEFRSCLQKRSREGFSVAERKLNRERVETYLSKMDESIQRLVELRKRLTSYEDFMDDKDTRELCVHHLRISLECVLDICRHFLAVKGVTLSDLGTINLIELAGERGLLHGQFARRIKGMAGMRNAIVHVYWRLDYEAIYRAVTGELEDFDEFARQVNSYL